MDVVVPHAEHDAALAGDGGGEGHLLLAALDAKVRQEARLARPQLRQPQVALVSDAENTIESAGTKLSRCLSKYKFQNYTPYRDCQKGGR